MRIAALPAGMVPLREQAKARGEELPIGAMARDLRARGYQLVDTYPDYAVLEASEESPTGFVLRFDMCPEYALAY